VILSQVAVKRKMNGAPFGNRTPLDKQALACIILLMSNITDEYKNGRRSRTKGEASRVRLLAAATAAFAERGYHDTKVSDIVHAAGLTQPAFYLYFASKEAIFAELIASFQAQLQQLASAVLPPASSSSSTIADHIRANLEALYRLLDADHQLTHVVLVHNPDADRLRDELAALMRVQLEQAQATGVLRTSLDLDVVAFALIGMAEQLARRWLLTGEKDVVALAAAHADLALNGVFKSQ
jgi:TetR/AcrR family transcriptional regulator, fatty acid metabolism regulator protein